MCTEIISGGLLWRLRTRCSREDVHADCLCRHAREGRTEHGSPNGSAVAVLAHLRPARPDRRGGKISAGRSGHGAGEPLPERSSARCRRTSRVYRLTYIFVKNENDNHSENFCARAMHGRGLRRLRAALPYFCFMANLVQTKERTCVHICSSSTVNWFPVCRTP